MERFAQSFINNIFIIYKIFSIVKDVKVAKASAIHDVHLANPEIFIKVVNEYLADLKV